MRQVAGTTQVLAVLGSPIRRSRSPQMHNHALQQLGLDFVYVAMETDPSAPGAAAAGLRTLGIRGANVTVPLKERLLPHMDALAPSAQRAGALNTVVNQGGRLVGHNTDGEGLFDALEHRGRPPVGSVLVLGAGGTGRAVAATALARGAAVQILNRTEARARAAAASLGPGAAAGPLTTEAFTEAAARADLVVHCTAAGRDAIESLDLRGFAGHTWVDVNYWEGAGRPAGLSNDAAFLDGTAMLAFQGARALSLFVERPVPGSLLLAALETP